MKVVFLLPSLQTGGTERQVHYLSSEMSKLSEVWVITIIPGGVFWDQMKNEGLQISSLSRSGKRDPRVLHRLIFKLKEIQPDILQTMLPPANVLGLLAKPFVSLDACFTGIRASNMEQSSLFSNIMFKTDRLLSTRYADGIISNSKTGKSFHIKQGFSEEKLRVIPNAVDLDGIREKAQTPLGISIFEREFSIGMFARVAPMKDHETLLRSLVILKDQIPNLKVYLAGRSDKNQRENLIEKIKTLELDEVVEFLGELSNPYPLMRQVDIVVSSSQFGEGMSNSIMEAMVLGKPIIATRVGDTPVLIDHENSGILVEKKNPEALAQQIINISNRKEFRKKLGEQAKKDIERYSIKNICSKYKKVWSTGIRSQG